ncbi:hypothetical protein RU97_GL002055 [Enterococcus canis]|uniref:Gram-positive cocci surface proteins LPxTG domain-containing protein n=1 Tax=Enterococcus canis TaxID=214095 RepID=A0A1L8RE65_9ENTE|nr:hypothetical protein RU97_GL002055 [Enterococcus canis]
MGEMRVKTLLKTILVFSVFSIFLTTLGITGVAAENKNPSQKTQSVVTEGVIVFEDDSVVPPQSSETQESKTSESQATVTPTKPSPGKPSASGGGKYPSTGEVVKKSLMYSGLGIIFLVLILFLIRRRKKEESQ